MVPTTKGGILMLLKAILEGVIISLAVLGNVTLFYILTLEFNIVIAFLSLAIFTIGIMMHFLNLK